MTNIVKDLESISAVFYLEDRDINALNKVNLEALNLLCSGKVDFRQGNVLSKICQQTNDAIEIVKGDDCHREGVAVAMVEVAYYWACEYERLVGEVDATQKQTSKDPLKLQG